MRTSLLTLIFTLLITLALPTQAQELEVKPAQENRVGLQALYSQQSYKARETHGAVEVRSLGQKENRVLLFVPAEPSLDEEAPIVFFHHGWQGMNPLNFGGVIDHLARTGHVVIFPLFQDGERTDPRDLTQNAAHANRLALTLLAEEFNLTPMQGRTLYYSFSIGGAISVNIASNPQKYDLPPPDALFMLAPGDAYHLELEQQFNSIYEPLEKLPPSLPIVIMAGEEDEIALPTARLFAKQLCHIPRQHRIVYTLPSSIHAGKKVTAGHGSPGAPDNRYNFSPNKQQLPSVIKEQAHYEQSPSFNQLDLFGYWKIMDALLEGLQNDKRFPEIVFGTGTLKQLDLGTWSDGTLLKPMYIEDGCQEIE